MFPKQEKGCLKKSDGNKETAARKPAEKTETTETTETQKVKGETRCKQNSEVRAGLTLIALWRAEHN